MAKEDDTQASHLKGHMGEIEYHSKYSRSDRIVIPNLGKLYHDKEDLRDLSSNSNSCDRPSKYIRLSLEETFDSFDLPLYTAIGVWINWLTWYTHSYTQARSYDTGKGIDHLLKVNAFRTESRCWPLII